MKSTVAISERRSLTRSSIVGACVTAALVLPAVSAQTAPPTLVASLARAITKAMSSATG